MITYPIGFFGLRDTLRDPYQFYDLTGSGVAPIGHIIHYVSGRIDMVGAYYELGYQYYPFDADDNFITKDYAVHDLNLVGSYQSTYFVVNESADLNFNLSGVSYGYTGAEDTASGHVLFSGIYETGVGVTTLWYWQPEDNMVNALKSTSQIYFDL